MQILYARAINAKIYLSQIGVIKMFKKHILAKFYAVVLLLIAVPSSAGALPDNIELGTKLNLFAAYASVPDTFLTDYKVATFRFDVNFVYHATENLSINFLPYAIGSYDTSRRDKEQTRVKIWQAYADYKLADFDFNLGRFDFVDEALAPFIYYGDELHKDISLPSALDGLKHNFTSKHLDYTLLVAQEAQIDEYAKAKIAGAKVTAKFLTWLNVSGFYFYQNKKYPQNTDKINSKLSIYGAGVDLHLSESTGLRFYGAKNGGEKKTIRPSMSQKRPYKGYAFNGELYSQTLYKTGTLNSELGFYLFSDKEKFETSANDVHTGIIYEGMNYNDMLPSNPQIGYAIFDFNFKKYSYLYGGLGIFVYSSGKRIINNRNYYAKEINLNMGLNFDTWGLKVSGGLFEGEAIFLGGTTTDKQKIKKIQANFFYKFSL